MYVCVCVCMCVYVCMCACICVFVCDVLCVADGNGRMSVGSDSSGRSQSPQPPQPPSYDRHQSMDASKHHIHVHVLSEQETIVFTGVQCVYVYTSVMHYLQPVVHTPTLPVNRVHELALFVYCSKYMYGIHTCTLYPLSAHTVYSNTTYIHNH